MKNPFIPLLIIGLLLFASFGLVMMDHMDGQGHTNCPLQAVGANDCAQVRGPLDFVISHLNAVSKFFSAIPAKTFATSIFYLLALLSAALAIFNRQSLILLPALANNRPRESFAPPRRMLLNHWFSLHENSPSFIGGRW